MHITHSTAGRWAGRWQEYTFSSQTELDSNVGSTRCMTPGKFLSLSEHNPLIYKMEITLAASQQPGDNLKELDAGYRVSECLERQWRSVLGSGCHHPFISIMAISQPGCGGIRQLLRCLFESCPQTYLDLLPLTLFCVSSVPKNEMPHARKRAGCSRCRALEVSSDAVLWTQKTLYYS